MVYIFIGLKHMSWMFKRRWWKRSHEVKIFFSHGYLIVVIARVKKKYKLTELEYQRNTRNVFTNTIWILNITICNSQFWNMRECCQNDFSLFAIVSVFWLLVYWWYTCIYCNGDLPWLSMNQILFVYLWSRLHLPLPFETTDILQMLCL